MRTQQYPGWFLTLTYDEKHVKRVAGGRLSLRFRDVQLYLKQIRKAKYYCKYICVGEYGGITKRPHYHLLMWTDCPADELESIWRRGHIYFGKLEMGSAMYTLKYIIQPKPPEYEGVEKPRAQFSRGLGLAYLTAAVYNWHTEDYENPIFHSYINGQKVALPRYYRSKIFTKYQTRKNGSKVKWDSIRKRRVKMRELIAQGVVNTKVYIQNLRAENARRIIKKTKFNQTL